MLAPSVFWNFEDGHDVQIFAPLAEKNPGVHGSHDVWASRDW
jgi:hypothetical protein